MESKNAQIVGKYLTNEKVLAKLATALLELDEFEDGEILSNEDYTALNNTYEVF